MTMGLLPADLVRAWLQGDYHNWYTDRRICPICGQDIPYDATKVIALGEVRANDYIENAVHVRFHSACILDGGAS